VNPSVQFNCKDMSGTLSFKIFMTKEIQILFIVMTSVKNYIAVFCAGEGMHNQEQQC